MSTKKETGFLHCKFMIAQKEKYCFFHDQSLKWMSARAHTQIKE